MELLLSAGGKNRREAGNGKANHQNSSSPVVAMQGQSAGTSYASRAANYFTRSGCGVETIVETL